MKFKKKKIIVHNNYPCLSSTQMYLLNELFSPFITPFVLLLNVRPKSLELVDFFRNFTVSVVGVGDVCSFAQMDVRKHGNPDWQIPSDESKDETVTGGSPVCDANNYTQGEHGKTELSLVHFTLTNPQWKMPTEARQFVQGIRRNAMHDLNRTRGAFGGIGNGTAMGQSLMSVESMGGEVGLQICEN
jgi:autophagy-related protein 9